MKKQVFIAAVAGVVVGVVVTGAVGMAVMPSQMLTTYECSQGHDETVEALRERIQEAGWVVSGVTNMNESMAKHGAAFDPHVTLVKLCKPDYAQDILKTDRHVSVMMPCGFSIWQGDDGKTYLTKMNTGLMGRMFGGNVARVMGGPVARDEEKMLEGLVRQ